MIAKLRLSQRLYIFLSLGLLWPAILNGTPFFFPDTRTYVRGADAAVYTVTGHTTEFSDVILEDSTAWRSGEGRQTSSRAFQHGPEYVSSYRKNILLGRSIYYGFLLYIGALFNDFFLTVALQAILTGFVILGASRHIVDPRSEERQFRKLVLLLFGISAITSLPYFVSFLMPDLFSGLAIVAAAVIVAGWEVERPIWRLFWMALLCFSALAHSTNVLILAILAGAVLLGSAACQTGVRWKAVGLLLTASAVGVIGDLGFNSALTNTTGRTAIRPPFLSARLINDGVGVDYLQSTCPGNGLVLCNFLDRLPRHSDGFLWDPNPATGVFTPSAAEVQARLAHEDAKFALGVLSFAPINTVHAVAKNSLQQFVTVGLGEFNDPTGSIGLKLPAPFSEAVSRSLAHQGSMPVWVYKVYALPLVAGSLIVIFCGLLMRGYSARWLPTISVVLLGIAANALICGAMSGAHDRYQDRVIWILPLAAAAFGVSRFLNRRPLADQECTRRQPLS